MSDLLQIPRSPRVTLARDFACNGAILRADDGLAFSDHTKANLMLGSSSQREKKVPYATVALAALWFGSLGITVHATAGQPGTLDATFGAASPLPGSVVTPIPNWSQSDASAVAIQQDGKIVVGSTCHFVTDAFCATRYLPNGTLDVNFGVGGSVANTFPAANPGFTHASASGIAVQPDGKIVQTGYCDWVVTASGTATPAKFCAIRYLPNGTLDPTFATAGRLMMDMVPVPSPRPTGFVGSHASSVVVQPDGKVVVSGTCSSGATVVTPKFCLLRLTASGTPDSQFGPAHDGKVITAVLGVSVRKTQANALALQSDGKLIVAGDCESDLVAPTTRGFCSIRVHGASASGVQAGTVDTSYGAGGTAVITVGPVNDSATGVALQADGKVVIGGWCARVGSALIDMCAARLTANGLSDVSFGTNGATVLSTTSGEFEKAYSVAVQADGKILLAGMCTNDQVPAFCVKRLYDNGTRDTTFNGNGTARTGISPYNVSTRDEGHAMALQADGKIVVAGVCQDGTVADSKLSCALRYDAGPFAARVCSVDLDGDGRFLATTDGLIFNRVGLGLTGDAVVAGIGFAPEATRTTWPLIREYLVTQCGMSLAP